MKVRGREEKIERQEKVFKFIKRRKKRCLNMD
jgi:hypothetical protein